MPTSKDLMRQKVNVTSSILLYWEKCMSHNLRQSINKWLLQKEDLGSSFTFQEREFTLIGMNENNHCMLREIINGIPVYWECTTDFVQLRLGKFYTEWSTINSSDNVIRQKDYDLSKLFLPPHRLLRKTKKTIEETETESITDYDFVPDVAEDID